MSPDRAPAPDTRLRDAGLRATQPRMTILGWLDGHPGHHPAETLVDRTGLSKATVYHVLGQLCEAGLVLPAESGAGRMLYETGADPHHHFVCQSCGRIIDVPCIVGERPCLTAEVPGAEVEQADVILKGRCADCRVRPRPRRGGRSGGAGHRSARPAGSLTPDR